VDEVDGIYVADVELGRVLGVCGGGSEGLHGMSVAGNDFNNDKG
jgi:hypothetical protein